MLKHLSWPFSTYFAIGLIIGISFTNLQYWQISLCLIFITIAFIKKQWSPNILAALFGSIVIGYIAYWHQNSCFENFKNQINHQTFSACGQVVDYEKIQNSSFKHRLTLNITSLFNKDKKLSCHNKIAIYTQKFPDAYIGENIICNQLKFNFGFDQNFEKYLIKNNLAANVFVASLDFKKNNITSSGFLIEKYKRQILKKINQKMNLETKVMFNTIFLGYKNEAKLMQNKLKNEFQSWGIIHYLARSGLHMVIISSIWQTACAVLQIPITISNILILFLMILFSILTWNGLPFIRALIMIICYRLCHFFKLQVHLLHILNLSCILMLLHNPIVIFFLDFQLSFLLTYGLVFLNEILNIQNKSHKKTICCL